MPYPVHLVWLKRDLRLADHAPLWQACQHATASHSSVLLLYVIEPCVIEADTFDPSHWVFIANSLALLQQAVAAKGGKLVIRQGEVTTVLTQLLDELSTAHPVVGLWSHEETGDLATYARDKAVAAWAKQHGIPWVELPQTGVVRRLPHRDGWAKQWQQRMAQPLLSAPQALPCHPEVKALVSLPLPTPQGLGLAPNTKTLPQAGEAAAHETLLSFLTLRGQPYQKAMSAPAPAQTHCSRLSPYLAYGNISIKQVVQATQHRQTALSHDTALLASLDPLAQKQWQGALRSFDKRLHWHCHFMQKLEDDPTLENNALCRALNELRPRNPDPALFVAWCKGETGFPMVDACMKSLHATGWLTFRMRAMLVSFACYQLWCDWRPVARYLATQFLDYEPGIHYPQVQMQAGVTGINALRIYSPSKQVADHDPEGEFIKAYLPALAGVPSGYLAQPHTMPPLLQAMVGCVIGQDYPAPIVDPASAYHTAKQLAFEAKRSPQVRAEAQQVYQKHGSRQGQRRRSKLTS